MGEEDIITDMRFLSDDKTIRIDQTRGNAFYQIDFNIVLQGNPETKRMEHHRYEDRSIFKYGLTYVQHHEALSKFILQQEELGNMVIFPEKEFQSCVVLNREDRHNKYFLLYDVFSLG